MLQKLTTLNLRLILKELQSYENTLTNFHIFNQDKSRTVTNHHDINVLHKVTGEVEFNVS